MEGPMLYSAIGLFLIILLFTGLWKNPESVGRFFAKVLAVILAAWLVCSAVLVFVAPFYAVSRIFSP
jgi:hypothetical protein